MPWYVYLLRLENDCIYVGCTNDLERRLAEHRGGSGSKITSESSVVELIYSESFSERACALTREQQLKRWSRAKKLALATGRLVELKRLARRRAHSCRGERTTQPPRMHRTAN
jgi:predicted GIY-YIG superfamily endonuclease